MRVEYIIQKKMSAYNVNRGVFDILHQRISSAGVFTIVDKSPEIIHIIGQWSKSWADKIESLHKKGIPVVFTSASGLSPLLNAKGNRTMRLMRIVAIRRICKYSTVIHTGGPAEDGIIKSFASSAKTVIVPNAAVTSAITEDTMVAKFSAIYSDAYTRNNTRIKNSIEATVEKQTDNKVIANICACIMYLKALYHSGCIPQKDIDEASAVMTSSNYNEAEAVDVMRKLGLLQFAEYCMAFLENNANLTEGFMPVRAKQGKTARKMQKMIVQ